MQKFQSHKIVEAAKIVAVDDSMNSPTADRRVYRLQVGEGALEFVDVDAAWVARHSPNTMPDALVGGYVVSYPGDGYLSWSPAEAFETGYTAVDEGGGFKAPPVAGYNDQSGSNLTIVNSFKEAEERVLRRLDEVAANAAPGAVDQRWYAIGRTHIEQGFMAVNRAIFQPGRVKLPGDAE
jgi:hypothetical protein